MERDLGKGRGEIPKWEYLFVTVTSDGKVYRPRTLNFKDIKDSKKTDLADFSNELGNQGWELVGSGGYTVSNDLLIFKRPKMSEKPAKELKAP